MDSLEYLNKLKEKIIIIKSDMFWLIFDRENFKQLKNYSDKELFKSRIKYYADKKITIVNFYIDNKESNIKKNYSWYSILFLALEQFLIDNY